MHIQLYKMCTGICNSVLIHVVLNNSEMFSYVTFKRWSNYSTKRYIRVDTLILLAARLSHFKCTRSFSPSMVKMLLCAKFSVVSPCSRVTPYIRSN